MRTYGNWRVGMFLTISAVPVCLSSQTQCSHGTEMWNGQQVETDTYTSGSNTVKNFTDDNGNIFRTEQTNAFGDLTQVNYYVEIGQQPEEGVERNHAVLIAMEEEGGPESHSQVMQDTDSQVATPNMKAAYANCH